MTKIRIAARSGITKQFSLKSLQEEVAKCRVLCANHHQKHTIQQFGYKKWLTEE